MTIDLTLLFNFTVGPILVAAMKCVFLLVQFLDERPAIANLKFRNRYDKMGNVTVSVSSTREKDCRINSIVLEHEPTLLAAWFRIVTRSFERWLKPDEVPTSIPFGKNLTIAALDTTEIHGRIDTSDFDLRTAHVLWPVYLILNVNGQRVVRRIHFTTNLLGGNYAIPD